MGGGHRPEGRAGSPGMNLGSDPHPRADLPRAPVAVRKGVQTIHGTKRKVKPSGGLIEKQQTEQLPPRVAPSLCGDFSTFPLFPSFFRRPGIARAGEYGRTVWVTACDEEDQGGRSTLKNQRTNRPGRPRAKQTVEEKPAPKGTGLLKRSKAARQPLATGGL